MAVGVEDENRVAMLVDDGGALFAAASAEAKLSAVDGERSRSWRVSRLRRRLRAALSDEERRSSGRRGRSFPIAAAADDMLFGGKLLFTTADCCLAEIKKMNWTRKWQNNSLLMLAIVGLRCSQHRVRSRRLATLICLLLRVA